MEALTQSFLSFSFVFQDGTYKCIKGFSAGSDGKEFACNAGDTGSIPGSGRSLEEEMATHFSILSWKIPWTEELQSIGSQSVGHNRAHAHTWWL